MNIEIIGGIGASLTTLAYLPQAIKTLKTKDTKSISLAMFVMMNIGNAFWLAYGLLLKQNPIIWANLITLLFAGYILFIKIRNVVVNKESM
jgi:MtN3 and saliva related transmembrane protein